MLRRFLIGKIHRATITETHLDYEGSVGLDEELMEAAGMLPGEMVHIFNINNGHRFETYTIPLPPGSKAVVLNGAAARLGEPGDRVIIIAYALAEQPPEVKRIELDENNVIR